MTESRAVPLPRTSRLDLVPMSDHAPIRAVFFDIDGTLTSFRTHAVPPSTLQALHALRERDVRIFICTGRAPEQMRVVLDAIPVEFDGIAGVNGQYCWAGDTVVASRPLDPSDVRAIVGWLDAHPGIAASFGEADATYFNRDTPQMRTLWSSLGKTAPRLSFVDPHTRLDHAIYEISPYVDEDQEREILALTGHVRGVRWHPDFVDLIPADGGKDRGMEALLSHFGIPRGQSMAFGDGGNDVDMLRYAAVGVAMGNGTDEAKEAADWVTDDVDDDGILHALEHFSVL